MRRAMLMIVMLIGLGLSTVYVVAQTPDNNLTAEAVTILQAINERRRTNNIAYVVPNDTLNQIAQTFANDLASRPEGSRADVYLTTDGDNLDTLLNEAGFPSYSDGYVADLVPVRLFNIAADQLLNYIVQDAALGGDRTIASRRMVQGLSSRLPLFEPPYREIGVGYQFNETTERYTYVMILASRPGVLPVVITDPNEPSKIATTVFSPNVVLRIQNESSHITGDQIAGEAYIGAVQSIRISESADEIPCPTNAFDTSSGWQPYNNRPAYTLTDGFGVKTVYVQMCDDNSRTVISSAQVTYTDQESAEEDSGILDIVHATQTAAAEATAFEPIRPTVEAILTATASAE